MSNTREKKIEDPLLLGMIGAAGMAKTSAGVHVHVTVLCSKYSLPADFVFRLC